MTKKNDDDSSSPDGDMVKYGVSPDQLSDASQGLGGDGHLVDCRSRRVESDGVCRECLVKISADKKA